jgi:tetratricopeptide (TPR) repeat protein
VILALKKYSSNILLVLLCLLQLNSFGQKVDTESNEPPLIIAGKKSLLNGNYEQSILQFSEHLKVYGFSTEAYYWRAHCLLQMGEYEKATIDLKLVLDKNPKDSKAMDAMGFANNQMGQYLKAIEWFNKAISYDNDDAVIYNNRGMSYYYLEKFSTAFHDFNKAILLDSTFAQAYNNRGSARYNRQNIAAATILDMKQAEDDFTKAIELDNVLVSAYRNRGIVRYHLEKYRESFIDFQKAIYLNPEDPLIYYHTGNLMFAKKDYNEAIVYYNQCLALKSDLEEVLYKRAETYELLENFPLARYDYEVLIELNDKETGKCFYHIAKTYALENDGEHACYYLNQAKKNQYFKTENIQKQVLEEPAFAAFWTEKNCIKLKESLE